MLDLISKVDPERCVIAFLCHWCSISSSFNNTGLSICKSDVICQLSTFWAQNMASIQPINVVSSKLSESLL